MEEGAEREGITKVDQGLYIFEQILCSQCHYLLECDVENRVHRHYNSSETENCPNYGKKFKLRQIELEEIKD